MLGFLNLSPNLVHHQRRLSCDEAYSIQNVVLGAASTHQNNRPRRTRCSASGVLVEFRASILPSLRRLIFTSSWLDTVSIESMTEVHNLLFQTATAPNKWESLRSKIIGSPEFSELTYLFSALAKLTGSTPASFDVHNPRTAQAVHFMFDIGAFLGWGFATALIEREIGPLTEVILYNAVTYRSAMGLEFRRGFVLPEEEAILSSPMVLAETITDCARIVTMTSEQFQVSNMEELRRSFLRFLFALSDIKLAEAGPRTAEEALLRHLLRTEMCPKVESMLSGIDLGDRWRKTLLGLIEFCVDSAPTASLIRANYRLLKIPVEWPSSLNLTPLEMDDAVLALKEPNFDWIRGFNQAIPEKRAFASLLLKRFVHTNTPFIDGGQMQRFRTVRDFPSQEDFVNTMVGFGRAIALVVRHGLHLSDVLYMRQALVAAIYGEVQPDDQLAHLIGLTAQRVPISQKTVDTLIRIIQEPAFFVKLGVRDVMGPLGLTLFAKSQRGHQLVQPLV